MAAEYASQNNTVQSIRKALLQELETDKIFVEWRDKKAKMVKMIIEGENIIHREYFEHIVGDMLSHDVFSYDTHPAKGRDWAETHILFHVD